MPKAIEKKVLFATVLFFCASMVCMIAFSLGRIQPTGQEETAERDTHVIEKSGENGTGNRQIPYMEGMESSKCLIIPLAEGVTTKSVQITNDYRSRHLSIQIAGMDVSYLAEHGIMGSLEGIEDYWCEETGEGLCLNLLTDSVCEGTIRYQNNNLYLELLKPKDVYDRIVVLDAGHGGADAGIRAMEFTEKELALDIVLRLKDNLEAEGIQVYCTREEDMAVSDEERALLMRETGADFIVSLHMTADTKDAELYGIRSYYNGTFFIPGFGSGDLAYTMEEALAGIPEVKGLGVFAGENEYELLEEANIPATLIELGYMSNQKEMSRWSNETYKQKLAEAMCDGILSAYEQKEEIQ